MRILFMGTPDFAVASLKRILKDGNEICGVFTQPDRPKGRGYTLCPPPVKQTAQEEKIPVFQPESLKGDAQQVIKDLAPDLIVVVAYGRILPESVLAIPPLGCVNVHASLLPKYRGAAPIQWSIINGEKITGVTTMFMSKGIDTGDMILKKQVCIGENETYGELHDRLMELGAQALSETVVLLQSGTVKRNKQDDSLSCYAPMIDKKLPVVDFNRPAVQVFNLIRGLSPFPAARTSIEGHVLKIHTAIMGQPVPDGQPGSITSIDKSGIFVCCGDGQSILLTMVQEQGGKKMSAADYIRGHRLSVGDRLGS